VMSIHLSENRQTRSTRIVFYYDSSVQPKDCDVKRILDILKRLRGLEVNVKIVDMDGYSDEERTRSYFDAIIGAVIQRAAIRQVFGSRKMPAFLFGGEVPALLIYDEVLVVSQV